MLSPILTFFHVCFPYELARINATIFSTFLNIVAGSFSVPVPWLLCSLVNLQVVSARSSEGCTSFLQWQVQKAFPDISSRPCALKDHHIRTRWDSAGPGIPRLTPKPKRLRIASDRYLCSFTDSLPIVSLTEAQLNNNKRLTHCTVGQQ